MFLGRSNYEQDAYKIRPLVMERGRLTRDAAATDTTVYINSLPRGVGAYGGYVVIDPYTTECEIRQITARAGKKLTMTALAYSHSRYDEVLFVDCPICNVKLFGAMGDDSTNDYTSIARALTQANSIGAGVVYIPDGTYQIGTGLVIGENVSLIGENVWSSILKATAGITMISISSGSATGYRNTRIENLRINGNGTASVGIAVGQAPLSSFRNLDIVSCTGGTLGYGVLQDKSQNQMWDTVRVDGCNKNFYIANVSAGNTYITYIAPMVVRRMW